MGPPRAWTRDVQGLASVNLYIISCNLLYNVLPTHTLLKPKMCIQC